MNRKSKFLRVAYGVLFIYLSACAANNEIVIKSTKSFQSNVGSEKFYFRFPSANEIQFENMGNSSWNISGDISDIARQVVSSISAEDVDDLSGSNIVVKNIKIRYQDLIPGGANSTLIIALQMQYVGTINGIHIENCPPIATSPSYSAPVSHGIFTSKDKRRLMVQPVYEDLIKKALTGALHSALSCLTSEAQHKLDQE